MIIFSIRVQPGRATAGLPLSVLALAAVLEGREEYAIVDGNIDEDPTRQYLQLIDETASRCSA